jgi:hypothetical protein
MAVIVCPHDLSGAMTGLNSRLWFVAYWMNADSAPDYCIDLSERSSTCRARQAFLY